MIQRLLRVLADPRLARRAALAMIVLSLLPRLINLNAPIWDAHSWNQCTTASVARNLWRSDFDWLHPQWDVLDEHSGPPKIEAEEAPVYHLLAAAGYALLGESLAWARLVTIMLYLAGALWLLALARRELGPRAAFFAVLFYAFAPVNVFFNRAVASDTGMVSLGIGALYYFRRYSSEGGFARWCASLICLALSGLFKPFGLLIGVPLLGISLERWGKRALLRPALWLYALIGLAVPLAWVDYAASIGTLGRGGAQKGLFGTLRLWGSPKLLISPRWWGIVQSWIIDRSLTPPAAVLAAAALLSKAARHKARLFGWWALGCLLYLLIVRSGNEEHIYYSMPWMPALAGLAGAGMDALLSWSPTRPRLAALARRRTALALALLLTFACWSAVYSRGLFLSDRSSVIAGRAAAERLGPQELLIAWDPGTTRKTQLIYHADRRGWHVQDPSPGRIEQLRLLGATAVAVCLSEEQAGRPDRAATLDYLERNFELLWSDSGTYGKRGEPHRLALYRLPRLSAIERPAFEPTRSLTADQVSGPWNNLLAFPGLGDPNRPLNDEELRFGLVKHMARGRLIHFLESRESLLIVPGVKYSFPVSIPERARLTFSAGVWPEILQAFGNRMTISAEFVDGDTDERVPLAQIVLRRRPLRELSWKLRESWQVKYEHIDFWQDAAIDLWSLAGRTGLLEFTCSAAGAGQAGDLERLAGRSGVELPFAAALAEPKLVSLVPVERRPTNLLVILVDGMRPDALSCYGYGRDTSPRIDALARRGALFERAYAASNYTRGSTSGMLTGEHPGLLGVPLGRWNLSLLEKLVFRRRAADGLIARLRNAGYATCQIGSNPFLQEPVPFGADAGFERVYSFNLRALDTAAIAATARRFLDQHRRTPFALYLHFNNCHQPYRAPRPYKGRFDARIDNDPRTWPPGYDEEVAYADAAIGGLLERLDELGLSENTLVVLSADHGRGWDQGHPKGHGKSLYDGEVRVPLIVAGPGVTPGARLPQMVSLLDIAPTMARLAGIAPDPSWPGVDLKPALAGDPAALHQRIWLECGTAVGFKSAQYTAIAKQLPFSRAFKGELADGGSFLEIYDNQRDPRQLDNLALLPDARSRELATELYEHKRDLDNQRWEIARAAAGVDPRVIGQGDSAVGVYSDTFSGTYRLQLLPGAADAAAGHAVRGRVSCDGPAPCWIDMVFPGSNAVEFAIDEDRRGFGFSTRVDAQPVELSWSSFPELTPLRIAIELDGRPLDQDRLRLGPWCIPYAGQPALLGVPRDYRLLLSGAGAPLPEQLDEFSALLWMADRDPAAATGAMGSEVKSALRSWGYVK